MMKRRDFLSKSIKYTATATAGVSMLDGKRVLGANDRITLGLTGCGGRGLGLLRTYSRDSRFQFLYMADPDERRGAREFDMLKDDHNPKIKKLSDFRSMLDDKNLDVLMIATPDHWHALATILACQAGKDVFVEKPMCHNIWEGRQMVSAARKYNRVVQVGMQTRSAPYAWKALDYINSGKLGSIHLCKIFNMKDEKPYHADKSFIPPKEVNIDLWLGAAREKYAYAYDGKGWLYHWDFCNGDMMNDGIHQTDLARWLIGKRYPKSVYCVGGNFGYTDDREVADTQTATFEYEDMIVTHEVTQYTPYMLKTPTEIRNSDRFPYWPQNATRIELYGTKQFMIIGRHGGGWQVFSANGEVVAQEYGRIPDELHKENFHQCLQNRQRPNADPEEGHLSCLMVHLAQISYRLGGRKLEFDADTERIRNDEEANSLLKRAYRAYPVPETV